MSSFVDAQVSSKLTEKVLVLAQKKECEALTFHNKRSWFPKSIFAFYPTGTTFDATAVVMVVRKVNGNIAKCASFVTIVLSYLFYAFDLRFCKQKLFGWVANMRLFSK